jgi:dephospho-CoA kinase
MQKIIKVGITGGIGSGKTIICKIFEELGIPVYYADDRGKYLMNSNPDLKNSIINLLGKKAYSNDELDRKYIGSIVFNNPEKLEELNKLVHPVVKEDGIKWHNCQKNVPYTLRESAILIESGIVNQMDRVIVVNADIDVRINRVMKRDNVEKSDIMKRIENQITDAERSKYAHFVIDNNGDIPLIPQIVGIHKKIVASVHH